MNLSGSLLNCRFIDGLGGRECCRELGSTGGFGSDEERYGRAVLARGEGNRLAGGTEEVAVGGKKSERRRSSEGP